MELIDHYAGQLMPLLGAFLMVAATVASLQSCSVVDLVEIVAPFKFAFPGQSYLYVGYKAALPVALMVSPTISQRLGDVVYYPVHEKKTSSAKIGHKQTAAMNESNQQQLYT